MGEWPRQDPQPAGAYSPADMVGCRELPGFGLSGPERPPIVCTMFSVDEATATAVSQVYEASGELFAVVELRRHFPGITNNETAGSASGRSRVGSRCLPTPEANSDMSDQSIDALMARAIQADAVRAHPLVGWIVMRDLPEYPGAFVARLVIDAPTSWSGTHWPRSTPVCRMVWSAPIVSRQTRRTWRRCGFQHSDPCL
jgi:hypothetical protein